jgi:hypothetical protein
MAPSKAQRIAGPLPALATPLRAGPNPIQSFRQARKITCESLRILARAHQGLGYHQGMFRIVTAHAASADQGMPQWAIADHPLRPATAQSFAWQADGVADRGAEQATCDAFNKRIKSSVRC